MVILIMNIIKKLISIFIFYILFLIMQILGKDCILKILENFDNTNYDDVKYLCRLSQTCYWMYFLIKPLIKHLISFFKYKSDFRLLGHYESILTNDLNIMNYMKNKYSSPFLDYLNYDEISKLSKKYKDIILILNDKQSICLKMKELILLIMMMMKIFYPIIL